MGGTQDAPQSSDGTNLRTLTGYPEFDVSNRLNPFADPDEKVALHDSTGKVFAKIRKLNDGRWEVSNKDGKLAGYGSGRTLRGIVARFRFQGRGCMINRKDRDPGERPRGTDRSGGFLQGALFNAEFGERRGRPEFLGVRGFVRIEDIRPDITALQRGDTASADQGATVRTANRYLTGCQPKDIGFASPRAATSRPGQVNPRLPFYYAYQGGPTSAQIVRGEVAPGGYPRYANYSGYPNPAPTKTTTRSRLRLDRVRVVKVMANTTGVDAGGIVRAIMPVGRAPRFREIADVGYSDPNGGCRPGDQRSQPVIFDANEAGIVRSGPVKWSLVRTPGLVGFVPVSTDTSFAEDPRCGT